MAIKRHQYAGPLLAAVVLLAATGCDLTHHHREFSTAPISAFRGRIQTTVLTTPVTSGNEVVHGPPYYVQIRYDGPAYHPDSPAELLATSVEIVSASGTRTSLGDASTPEPLRDPVIRRKYGPGGIIATLAGGPLDDLPHGDHTIRGTLRLCSGRRLESCSEQQIELKMVARSETRRSNSTFDAIMGI